MAERRILVVANETVAGRELLEHLHAGADGADTHILVVAPALNTRCGTCSPTSTAPAKRRRCG